MVLCVCIWRGGEKEEEEKERRKEEEERGGWPGGVGRGRGRGGGGGVPLLDLRLTFSFLSALSFILFWGVFVRCGKGCDGGGVCLQRGELITTKLLNKYN